ncbi:Nudix (Nucleoside diphosphate linked moiety X)-type motif 1 [Dissophora globulifera]|nr:Nudix (Nucleoside diphosphate linked moiety X)-type motif 1 [Dissophora globulifera]
MDPFRITSKKVLTLVTVIDKQNQRILLGYKKRGFGAHLWNGFGGKVEPGETPKEGAIRELEEEAGITVHPDKLQKTGLLLFLFENDTVGLETHVYKAYEYEGEIRECDEMRPQWFDFADIPYSQMWPDDETWLPLTLKGQDPFFGRICLKRRPLSESASLENGDSGLNPSSSTASSGSTTSTAASTGNLSTTMTNTSFTADQPSNGPFEIFDYHLEHSLPSAPHEIALDGTVASYED